RTIEPGAPALLGEPFPKLLGAETATPLVDEEGDVLARSSSVDGLRHFRADRDDQRHLGLLRHRHGECAIADMTAPELDDIGAAQRGNDYIAARVNDAERPWHRSTRDGAQRDLELPLKPLHDLPVSNITADHIYQIIGPLRQSGRRATAHQVRLR